MNVIQNLLSAVSPQPDGDFVDKLNYCATTIGLVLSSAFITGWSFVGSPIDCWFPAYYKGWWAEYALDYCYVQNTFFVPFSEDKTERSYNWEQLVADKQNTTSLKQTNQIGYYQWVPFILALQAILFYFPVVIWRLFYGMAGQNVTSLCNTCTATEGNEESRKGTISTIAGYISQKRNRNLMVKQLSGFQNRANGSAVLTSYLFMKVLFLINVLLQFVLLKRMLGVDSYFWGAEVTADLWQGNEWPETGNFPRVTMCEYEVRNLDNIHKHSVQCVLMINMFNEKIFVALWWWLCFLTVVTISNTIYWFWRASGTSVSKNFIRPYVEDIDPKVKNNRGKLQQFVSEFLSPDTVFLLRIIELNNGKTPVVELIRDMWRRFNTAVPPPYSAPPLLVKDAAPLLKNFQDESEM
ncbi:hypothetical protein CAEBREN_17355 [Caenorhabditis brenneri]|uniref:Innexin n=1 Tax=Caenorhabditis brenneri TaxID=135651 RepID=G0PCQ6_CAEBE|nr:hypothetical protein CAEBREN_24075 [Caenorhabditis brenneri]EGT51263.1 hypothetical protein CAEBREN_17355 [Caenorhabditis brenneri]